MALGNDTASMALFCDFENIALGVRDAQYEKFDIRPVLERLLAKGSIVVKKAYCDWDRYKAFKSAMHEANFELIEIPHVRQSGKNSADIRMVVDALDLCYTKLHVDTFVIISGDSDFSPLVSKLRENAKKVIGVGVKQSCSDLLVTNCDEFIYYDDLVRDREASRSTQRREREKRSPEEEAKRREKQEERKAKAIDIVQATFVDLMADRGESDRIWASVLKEVVKRRNPGFNENYYGFRTFGNLLEDAAARGLLGFGRDDKGAYVFRAPARSSTLDVNEQSAEQADEHVIDAAPIAQSSSEPELKISVDAQASTVAAEESSETQSASKVRRRGGRRTRKDAQAPLASAEQAVPAEVMSAAVSSSAPVLQAESQGEPAAELAEAFETTAKPVNRRSRSSKATKKTAAQPAELVEASVTVSISVDDGVSSETNPKPSSSESAATDPLEAASTKKPRRSGTRTARVSQAIPRKRAPKKDA